jgi:predicted acyl esterase
VIPLADFAHLFRPGQRLGLAIRSELFPAAARNLGTMEPYATGTTVVVQENAIHSGPQYPSQLRLHTLPTALITHSNRDRTPGERRHVIPLG